MQERGQHTAPHMNQINCTGSITTVPGITAGHWTNLDAATGCTAILCRDGAVGGVAVRGGSPGTHETDLLNPVRRVDRVHAVMLSGGSAFGLATATGAQRWLEEHGIGFETPHGYVPIVPAAILYDLGVGSPTVRPDADAGYAACAAASSEPLAAGTVGAGTGATVAKALGADGAVKGGIGSASCTLSDGVTVGAVVAVNAWGAIYDPGDGNCIAGPRRADGVVENATALLMEGRTAGQAPPLTNTTIGVVATDATLDKMQANFIASSAHDGLALTIRPCHTPSDGDTLFCMSTRQRSATADLMAIVAAATHVTAVAVINAVQAATGLAGVPGAGD